MSFTSERTDDRPQDWERFAAPLREHAHREPTPEQSARMLERVHAGIDADGRAWRRWQWGAVGAIGASAAILLVTFGLGDRLEKVPHPNHPAEVRAADPVKRPPQRLRRRIQLPEVTAPPMRSQIDTNLPMNPTGVAPRHPVVPAVPPATTGGKQR